MVLVWLNSYKNIILCCVDAYETRTNLSKLEPFSDILENVE